MAFIESKDTGPDPMRPVWGFVLFVIVAGVSFVASGPALTFLTTTTFRLGTLGMSVLPIVFPPEMTRPMQQGVVGLVVFVFLFVIAMIVWASLTGVVAQEEDKAMSIVELRRQKARDKRRR